MIGPRVGPVAGHSVGVAVGVGADPIGVGGKTGVFAFGQSNSILIAPSANLTGANTALASAYAAVPYQYKIDGNTDPPVYTSGGPIALQPQTFNAAVRMGWQLSLMRELDWALPNQWVCLQHGLSSTSLAANWLYNGTYPTGDPDNLANETFKWCRARMAELGCTRVIFVWQQGENDAGSNGTASAYAANLANLVALSRTYFPAAPWVIIRLNSDYVNSGTGAFTSTVQAQEASYVAGDANSALVNIDAITPDTDHTHYTADGYAALGYLYAAPCAHLLGLKLRPHASFTTSAAGLTITFTDASIDRDGTITSWAWNFGDGATSSSQNPVHAYAGNGTYTVTLTVSDSNGRTDSTSTALVVTGTIVGVDRDATSLWYVPADATQWSTFNAATGNIVGAPARLWLLQDASGNAAAAIGGTVLTAAGTPGYQATPTGGGWTRKCVTIAAGGVHRFAMASGVGPSPATTSSVWLAIAQLTATPAAARNWAGLSNGTHSWQAQANNVPRLGIAVDGVTTTGTSSPVGLGMGAWGMVHNRASGVAAVFDPAEWLVGTYSAAVTDGIKGIGANGGTSNAMEFAYLVEWEGATAEAITQTAMRSLIQALGGTVAW